MTQGKSQIIYIILLAGIISSACLEDFNKDSDPLLYTPSYSIPIGPLNYTLNDIMPPEALDIPILDTSIIGDTIPLIIYDDSLFFENPVTGHDTIFTGSMNLSSISTNMEYARSLMFRIDYANQIPTDLYIQLYFYNGTQLLDSLFEDGWLQIANATPDQDGVNTIPVTGREEVYIDSSRIENFLQLTNYALSIHVQTYSEGLDIIHVYSFYSLDLQLALRAELQIPFE